MKLNPEIKQLRKENKRQDKMITAQQQKIYQLNEDKKVIRIKYCRIFGEPLIKHLNPREQKILKMRFGFKNGIPLTYEKLGQKLNVTRERIRQIEQKALEKIWNF